MINKFGPRVTRLNSTNGCSSGAGAAAAAAAGSAAAAAAASGDSTVKKYVPSHMFGAMSDTR